MSLRALLASFAATICLAGCASHPPKEGDSLKTAFAASIAAKKMPLDADDPVVMEPASWMRPGNPNGLAGRTLNVSSLGDIKLKHKEVVLTFDDGPVPGKTENILATLDRFGVKATFLMVGEMAQNHPAIAREVLDRGNTIGSHTFRHADLRGLNFDAAVAEFMRGEKAVAKATQTDVHFFRFPYLSDTRRLRDMLAAREVVVMDVDVDSKDYYKNSPDQVALRTMDALHKRGSGIILMHDIHKRTATLLPALLAQLKSDGYKVVTLRYKREHAPMVMASLR